MGADYVNQPDTGDKFPPGDAVAAHATSALQGEYMASLPPPSRLEEHTPATGNLIKDTEAGDGKLWHIKDRDELDPTTNNLVSSHRESSKNGSPYETVDSGYYPGTSDTKFSEVTSLQRQPIDKVRTEYYPVSHESSEPIPGKAAHGEVKSVTTEWEDKDHLKCKQTQEFDSNRHLESVTAEWGNNKQRDEYDPTTRYLKSSDSDINGVHRHVEYDPTTPGSIKFANELRPDGTKVHEAWNGESHVDTITRPDGTVEYKTVDSNASKQPT